MLPLDPLDGPLDGGPVGDVQEADRVVRGPPVGGHHLGAPGAERPHHGRADALRGAGHQGDPALEFEYFLGHPSHRRREDGARGRR